jgi:hypothetical protein
VERLDNLTLGVVGFCAGFVLFIALTHATGSGLSATPVRCEPPAWSAPSEAVPPLPAEDRPVPL